MDRRRATAVVAAALVVALSLGRRGRTDMSADTVFGDLPDDLTLNDTDVDRLLLPEPALAGR